jgi:hypothetical protein
MTSPFQGNRPGIKTILSMGSAKIRQAMFFLFREF